MKQNGQHSKAFIRPDATPTHLPRTTAKASESLAAVETFERERMGVAAKE